MDYNNNNDNNNNINNDSNHGNQELWKELDNVSRRLEDDGVSAQASAEERQFHLWRQLLTSEEKLQSATQELQTLRLQQADEMKEVESYVAHIRGLLEERECLTAEYERDNEHLRHEIQQIRHQQESQSKELAEMLAQEELGEMGLNGPSEQVAYLLVERATLLERLEAAERRLELHSLTGSLQDAEPQELVDPHLMGEHLRHQREDTLKTVDVVSKAQSEHISREQNERQRLERDLEEASRRLSLAHQEIRRLTNELDAAKNNNNREPSGSDLDGAVQEVENLKKEVDQLKRCDLLSLQRAKEQNDHLEAENRALKQKIHIVELEKKTLQDQLTVIEAAKADQRSINSELQNPPLEKDPVHKRCYEAVEDGLVQVRELQRQLHKLRNQQEDLEERNEELEALLGEAQNASKEERHRHEGELEGLQRKIKSLDAELKKQDAQEKALNNGEEVKSTEAFLQMHNRESSQERLALLEARLTEEKNWRKQLEMDLSAAQAALKKDKEALQIGERELKKLRLEINSLYTECQQGKTLIKSLTQVKGEKAVLEEKVAQMERAHSRLQSELQRHKESKQTQENLKENRSHVDHLQEKADRLTAELSTLQTENNTMREERNSERLQTADLHAKLSASVQEKLAAEGEAERLELEIQNLQKQLKWHQDALDGSKEQEVHLNLTESRLGTVQKTKKENLDELLCLKEELNYLQTKLTEEQKHAAQHQMVLQAQVNEAQARVKSQDSVLRQKGEEAKQMKQDLQRAQNLFTSAEKELRYEKEKNLDLKRHNTLLDQEKLKLSAELKQIQTKLVHVEQKFQTQVTEIERQQQKIREQELELARTSTNHSATTSLHQELQAERARLIAADEKVVELQQQLKTAQHHLRVEEARACESSRLERDSRDLSDTLSALRAQQQEEHITRKLLEQREEELQQQVRSLRLKETSLNRTNTELSHRVQQLDTRLSILEAELSKAREEGKENQKSSLRLQEELMTSQQECERLQGDVQQILLQLDANIRKYNEKHSQHKTKLRQAKQVFLKVTAQRDCTIQKLENDLVLASSLSHKEKEQIHTVVEENEKLLEEKRELLRKISEAEEMGSKGMRTASTVQHRVNVLEVENRQLQERTMMLSNQVSSLERALRNIQSLYSLESAKKPLTSEGLTDSLLPPSSLSLTTSSCDVLEILDAICRVKVGERAAADGTRSTFCSHPPSEQGYLNLTSTSPLASPASSKVTGENCGNNEQV